MRGPSPSRSGELAGRYLIRPSPLHRQGPILASCAAGNGLTAIEICPFPSQTSAKSQQNRYAGKAFMKAMRIVAERQAMLLERWNDYHG